MVSINAGLRIHRLNGHKFSPAQVSKNIGRQDIIPDKEKMAESNCLIEIPTVRQSSRLDISKGAANIREIREVTDIKIGTSYSDMFTITGEGGNETIIYMEQCYPVTKQVYEMTRRTES